MTTINAALETLATLTHEEVKMLNDKEVAAALEACRYLMQSLQTVQAARTAERERGAAIRVMAVREQERAFDAADMLKLKSIPEYADLVDTGSLVLHALRKGNKDAAQRLKAQMYDTLARYELDNIRIVAHLINA